MPTCPTCRTHYPEGSKSCDKDGEGLLPDEAFSSADYDLETGRVVGEYRIEGKLGKGGFGTVYRAVHPLIGKAAAVKVLARQFSSNPQMVSRFIAEARAVNQIRHRHIIDIFSFGSLDDGRQYFVMELLEGMTLDAYVKQHQRLTPEQAIPILRAIARALDAAHAREIAHRDLKPENVFLAMQDGEVFPKLLDFGIAKLMGDAAGSNGLKTNTGTPIGTPHYMSPEQCRGRDVDHRTDVYSFGIMAHELLTGQLPFEGGDIVELLMKQVMAPAPAMSSVCSSLSPGLDAPVLAMLEKDPARRPRTLGEAIDGLARAAREAGHDVILAPPPGESGARIVPPTSSARALAEAATIGATPVSIQTFQGTARSADALDGSGKRSRRLMIALGIASVVAAGLAVAIRAQSTADDARATARSAVSALPAPPAAIAAPFVEVHVHSTPPGATVLRGGQPLGKTPTKVRLARGGAKVPITLELEGHELAKIDVDPASDVTLSIPLRKTTGSAATTVVTPTPSSVRAPKPASQPAKPTASSKPRTAPASSGTDIRGELETPFR